MSKLYWMSQVIAVTNASELSYTAANNAFYPSTPSNVKGALDALAGQQTGIRMSQNITAASGSTSVSFHNSLFTDTMYVDYYSTKALVLDGFPTYDSSGKNLTFTYFPVEEDCTFRIVVKL